MSAACYGTGTCQTTGNSVLRSDEVEAVCASMLFAWRDGMSIVSRAVQRVSDLVRRVFPRTVALILGFAMSVVGVAMVATIVMLPLGVVIGLLGVAIFVGGVFAPDLRNEQTGHR